MPPGEKQVDERTGWFLDHFSRGELLRVLRHGPKRALADVVRVAFFAYATYLSGLLIPRMNNLKMTVIDVPMSVIYSFVMAGFVLMTIRAVQVAVRHWRQGWSVLERPGEAEV